MSATDSAPRDVIFDQKGTNPQVTGVNPIELDRAFRFTREISDIAPKPGHHLGDLSYTYNQESVSLYMIEGGKNNAMSFTGMASNFTTTRLLNFNFCGSFREQVDCLPYSPHDSSQEFLFSDFSVLTENGEFVEFPFVSAKAIYTPVRSVSGIDPDGTLIQLTDKAGKTTIVNLSGFKRGWLFAAVVVVAVVAVVVIALNTKKSSVKGTIKTKDFEADIDIQTENGASTAPITSGTKIK